MRKIEQTKIEWKSDEDKKYRKKTLRNFDLSFGLASSKSF